MNVYEILVCTGLGRTPTRSFHVLADSIQKAEEYLLRAVPLNGSQIVGVMRLNDVAVITGSI